MTLFALRLTRLQALLRVFGRDAGLFIAAWLCFCLLGATAAWAQDDVVSTETPASETGESGESTQDGSTQDDVTLDDVTLDEITVSAGYSLNRETPSGTIGLSRQDIEELPTFGDDLFRAISLVPGTAGNDVSSAFSVRGAPYEEILVRLDGIELFEPFHLKDYSGVLSVVDPQVVDGVEIFPGVFPAQYGDRQGGVVDLSTRTPYSNESRTGISLSSLYFTRGMTLGEEDQGAGLLSVRRGWLDIVFGLVGSDDEGEEEEGSPEYSDLFGKLDWRFGDRTEAGVWALWADDTLDSTETEDDGVLEAINSTYGNAWLVGRAQHLPSDRSVLSGRAFLGRVDRERNASEAEGQNDFAVRDVRNLDLLGVSADVSFQGLPWGAGTDAKTRHLLSAGFEARSYDADYDYAVTRSFRDPASGVSDRATDSAFDGTPSGESFGLWISDRWRVSDRLVMDLGLRYDRQDWLASSENQVSPRWSMVYDLGRAGLLRAGWGQAHQSQRPNELGVEDDDFSFYGAEKAEHRTIGWDRTFDNGFRLRVDAFQRLGSDLRPRYVNLFNPVVLFPEGSPDRVRLDADRYRAQGVEFFAQGRRGPRFNWWVAYTWSDVEERVDGVWLPRDSDQTHALTANAGFRLGKHWNLNAAWIFHTGHPITDLQAELVDGEVVPIPGPFFAERVDDYHRLDLRLSRDFELSGGRNLQLYLDVQNLYNRENQRGYEFGESAFALQADGSVTVTPEIDTWLGAVPSFGVTLNF